MQALFNFFSSLPLTTVWSKVKMVLLVGAVGFMVWQGVQMTSLQQDVTKLETVQNVLQAQVKQMSADYSMLRDNYKNAAKTSEQYFQSVEALNGKSTDLERSMSALDVKAAKASAKADTALSLQKSNTAGGNNETRSTQALASPVGVDGDSSAGTDDDWRRLLDNTYCSVYPSEPRCTQ